MNKDSKKSNTPKSFGGGLLFSIIVPCYNVELYLEECLKSLLYQNDILPTEYEIICVDDGSTDNTLKILNKMKEKHDNLRVLSKENGGVSSARNVGIKNATGSYITFVDPDDAVAFDLLNNVKKIIIDNKDIDLITGCFQSFDDSEFSKCYDVTSYYDKYDIITEKNQLRITTVKDILNFELQQNAPSAQFIYRPLLEKYNILFNEDLVIGEDEVFTFQVRKEINKCIFVPTVFYYYRLRKNSAMRTDMYVLSKRRQNSNKIKALIYKQLSQTDDFAIQNYISAVNQTCFMLLFIEDVKYVKSARKELCDLGLYPPKNINESCLQSKPNSLKLLILDKLKRLLKYPKLFWLIWFIYGFLRR